GERLRDLTAHRCKPATPFGGKFRIIDFVLSNCVNSGIRQISILTQYKAQSLIQQDRKSTRLNSSHLVISYAVFCLKKKNTPSPPIRPLGTPTSCHSTTGSSTSPSLLTSPPAPSTGTLEHSPGMNPTTVRP